MSGADKVTSFAVKGAGRELSRRTCLTHAGAGLLLLAGMIFPRFWYNRRPGVIVAEPGLMPPVESWRFDPEPILKAAEKQLMADEVVNGICRNADGVSVRWLAVRNARSVPDATGLFVHTPDRCWTESGWRLEVLRPDHVKGTIDGKKWIWERRLFSRSGHRELVYFGGLVDGEPPLYRLDHNLSVAGGGRELLDDTKTLSRMTDSHIWRRALDVFISRNAVRGRRLFLRASTQVFGEELANADKLLSEMLSRWMAGRGEIRGPGGVGIS